MSTIPAAPQTTTSALVDDPADVPAFIAAPRDQFHQPAARRRAPLCSGHPRAIEYDGETTRTTRTPAADRSTISAARLDAFPPLGSPSLAPSGANRRRADDHHAHGLKEDRPCT